MERKKRKIAKQSDNRLDTASREMPPTASRKLKYRIS